MLDRVCSIFTGICAASICATVVVQACANDQILLAVIAGWGVVGGAVSIVEGGKSR